MGEEMEISVQKEWVQSNGHLQYIFVFWFIGIIKYRIYQNVLFLRVRITGNVIV